jgi:hypothetical protein
MLMQAVSDTRLLGGPVHAPVEQGTADGKIRISCASAQCAAWNPRPFESRHEAQFWYERHIALPLIQHLW